MEKVLLVLVAWREGLVADGKAASLLAAMDLEFNSLLVILCEAWLDGIHSDSEFMRMVWVEMVQIATMSLEGAV